jgi:hypothetical protein
VNEGLDAKTLDHATRAFALIDTARAHGYSLPAAAQAALEGTSGLSRSELAVVTALLSALIGTELRPIGPDGLGEWTTSYRFLLAMMGPSE